MKHLQAIVFDFDGVIVDSEPLHLRAFQAALADVGVALEAGEYYARYLGYDDAGMFRQLAADRDLDWSPGHLASLAARKGVRLQELLDGGGVLFPGAADFLRRAAAAVPIAIASGALRHEILEIVGAAGLAELFSTIVAADDTPESKPSPAPYRLAVAHLREHTGLDIEPARTVAIEDSRWGLASARGAGLRCVGVTSSYPASELPGAELTVGGLADLGLEMLDELCRIGLGGRP
ncbi:MAG: HAD family hydrolase [Vicinamibacterales bacterium]